MTLTQITKIRGAGIHTTSNIVSHNIDSSGIITAVAFKGPFTGSSNIQSGIVTATKIDLNGDIDVDGHTNLDNVNVAGVATFASAVNTGALTATTGTFSGNVSIGGTLTYEDVTNIDSVGVITARSGLKVTSGQLDVGSNIKLGNAGVVTATSFVGGLPITSGSSWRVVTSSNASTLKGETNLQFDGTDLYISDGIKHKDDTNTEIGFPANDTFTVTTGGGERLRIDSAGKLLVGHTGRIAGDVTAQLQVEGTSYHTSSLALIANSGASAGNNSHLTLAKSRGSSAGSNTILADGDSIGIIQWAASDGTDLNCVAANIRARVNGTPGSNDMPGSLEFGTTADGAAAPTERLRIHSTGVVQIGDSTASSLGDRLLQIGKNNRSATYLELRSSSTGVVGLVLSDGTSGDAGYRGTIEYNHTSDAMFFKTAATERLRITSDGKLGIGENSPSTAMHLKASDAYFTMQASSSSGNAGILFKDSGGTQNSVILYDFDDDYLKITTNNDTERLRIDSSGRLRVANTNFSANGDGDTVIIGTTSGTRGMTIVSGNNNTGNIFFGDDGDNDIGGVIYNHNGNTLNFRANGLTRATVTGTAFWVDDGTNARLKLAPDSANLNMIISTTTGNGSYCNLLYGAADHIFKYGGNETARLSTAGNYTITGEFASAQDYPTIKPTLDLNFAATKTLDPRFEYYRYGPASYVDENGKVVLVGDDVPRFDHDPVTRECKGLLVEGERRNLLPYSFDAGKWVAGSAGTLTRDAGIAPDGTMTATKALSSSNDIDLNPKVSGTNGSSGNITVSSSVTYTLSVWAKASTAAQVGNNFKVRMKRVSGTAFAAETTFALTGNWARYSVTGTTPANVTQLMCYVGGVSGSEALVWGAQLESGTTASSLIPTYGYTQLRGADVVQITGEEFSDFYNQEEGTIFLSASYDTDARAAAIVTIDDISAYANYTEVGYRAGGASSGQLSSYIRTTVGNDQYYKNWASSATQGNEFKIALGYKDDNYASSANGSTVHTDTSGTTHKTYDRLKLSEVHTVGHGGVGYYRRLMYYSKRITNSQLVTLTS